MTKMVLDFDPLTGVTESLVFTHGGDEVRIVQEQDVSHILKMTKAMANDEDFTRQGIARDHWLYARIPDTIMLEMKTKYGVDWNDKNDKNHKRLLKCLNTHYPAFKTTAWNHE